MYGCGIRDIIPDRDEMFVPSPFTFTEDELRVLRESNVQCVELPPAGRIFCAECEPVFEKYCNKMVMQVGFPRPSIPLLS